MDWLTLREEMYTIDFNKEETTEEFPDVDEVTFENFHLIKQDGLLENTWWLYEEVYKVNNQYEFHALLENRENELIDFIISADRVSFTRKGL